MKSLQINEGNEAETQALHATVLWGGYRMKLCHDLANDLTTLSAIRLIMERSGREREVAGTPGVTSTLEQITRSLSVSVRRFHDLRAQSPELGRTLSGEEFERRLTDTFGAAGWQVRWEEGPPQSVVCHWDLLCVVLKGLQPLLAEPGVVTLTRPPASLTGNRPVLGLCLGEVNQRAEDLEENAVFLAVKQLVFAMNGLMECRCVGRSSTIRILLPRTD